MLVTSGRFPPATALVRAFHEIGARVEVADSYPLSPALHSHRADRAHVIAPPASEPLRFVDDVAEIVRARAIDLVVPSFEETYFLARYADRVPAPIFTSPFATVAELHDKSRFVALCDRIGLPTPATAVVSTPGELAAAVGRLDAFVARPAFSRGGLVYLTNHGPRAGESRVEDCRPTADNPWLVQEFVEGDDACSFSVVRDGEVVLHCPYEPTIAAEGGWSIQFTTIDDFGSLERGQADRRGDPLHRLHRLRLPAHGGPAGDDRGQPPGERRRVLRPRRVARRGHPRVARPSSGPCRPG